MLYCVLDDGDVLRDAAVNVIKIYIIICLTLLTFLKHLRCDCETPDVRRGTDRCSGDACWGVATELMIFFARAANI